MFFIKALKDLAVGLSRLSIDIKDLKDLRRIVTIEITGDRPPRYEKITPALKNAPLTVGRGPVPRHRSCTRNLTLARDRPPRYGEKRFSFLQVL